MAYASITYTSASGTTFALTNSSGDPIEYLRQADIAVTVNGVLQTQGTDYTFNSAGTAIVLATAVSGATVVISRTTSITDATVSFTAGSTLTAQDLNNSDKQNRFALQEFSDTYGAITTGTGDLSVLGGFIGSAETWVADNAHAATTGAIDGRVDSKIDTALTGDVVAGNAITITDNSPASGQITIAVTDGAIEAAELASNAVTTAKIADGNVTAAKLASDSVTTAKILDANVTTAKIANDAITSAKIADGTIIAGDIAADAITTAKILDANVTTAKIADANITTAKLADSSVTSAKIADGTIVAGDLASDSVTTAKIADNNVTTGKINDSAVTTAKIADSAVTAIKIADGVITSAKLNASTVVTAIEQSGSTPDDTSFFTTSASDGRYVNVTGDTMTGALAMSSNKITGLGTPTANADAATKQYVDGLVAAATLADADYGDITVSGTGTVWTIDNGVVTSAKLGSDLTVDLASGSAATPSLTFDANTGIYSPGADQVAISTNGTGRLTIDSSGNVNIDSGTVYVDAANNRLGVGTTSPARTVHVSGTATNILRLENTNADVSGIELKGSTGTSSFFHDGGDLAFYPNSSEKLRIKSDGKVGIGTSSPAEELDVAGANCTIRSTSTGDSTGKIALNSNRAASTVNGQIIGQWNGNTVSRIDFFNGADGTNKDDGEIAFATANNASSPVERMRITQAGNVGIGTTSPSDVLHVVESSASAAASTGASVAQFERAGNAAITISTADTGTSTVFFGDTASSTVGRVQYDHSDNSLGFWANSLERARIDSSGRLLVGTSTGYLTSTSTTTQPLFQVHDTNANSAQVSINSWATGTNTGGNLTFCRSDSGTVGTHTVVGVADALGNIRFAGSDGTKFIEGASITASADGTWGADDGPSKLVFSTTADGASSPTERMRISSGGQISQFSDAGWENIRVSAAAAAGTTRTFYTGYYSATAVNTGTLSYRVYTNGDVQNTNNSYGAISDIKLKENIVDANSQWDDIKALQVRNYNFKEGQTHTQIGLIAQEVELVSPGLVSESPDRDEDGNDLGTVTKSVNYSVLYMKAVKALQEAMERIETLEAKVAALESA